MADDTTNGESQPNSVLGSLPATRPPRLKREVTVAKAQGRGPRPAKAKPPRARAAAPKSRRPVQGAAPKSARGAAPTARVGAAAKTASGPRTRSAPSRNKPVAVSAGCPPLERPHAAEPPPRPIDPPRGTELVTTAIQATGELARIGFTLGGRALKRAVDRLPRP